MGGGVESGSYRVGLDADRRQRVQEGFMAGKLDVTWIMHSLTGQARQVCCVAVLG